MAVGTEWGNSASGKEGTEEQFVLELLELELEVDGLAVVFDFFVVLGLLAGLVCLSACVPAPAHRVG